jgi:hypothetical protein
MTDSYQCFGRRGFLPPCSGCHCHTRFGLSSFNRYRDNSVGVVTCYEMDDSGCETRRGTRFSTPVQTDPGVRPSPHTTGTGSFPGVKRSGCGVNNPAISRGEFKGGLSLYLYAPPPLCVFMAGYRVKFTFYLQTGRSL